jgi:prepilin-type N-terminal cleavage/methylation domain-containing protein
MKKSPTGFTLIEAAIVMALLGLLAAGAASTFVWARSNASAGAAALEVLNRFHGLKTRALAEQRDYVAVLVNPLGDVSTGCRVGSADTCARFVVVKDVAPGWTPAGFDPSGAIDGGTVDDVVYVDWGIVLDTGAIGRAAPAPFLGIAQLPPSMRFECHGGVTCYAIRFSGSGEVTPIETAAGAALTGVAFGFTSDVAREKLHSERRAALITFPTGITQTYQYHE